MTLSNSWNAWLSNNETGNVITCIGFGFLSLFLLLMLGKYIFNYKILISEFKNPILGSILPTTLTDLFVWSAFINSHHVPWLGEIIWLFSLGLFFVYVFCFMWYQVTHWKYENVWPSWFIVWVGIIVFCVVSSNMGSELTGLTEQGLINVENGFSILSKAVWWFGFVGFLVLLVLIIHKVIFYRFKIGKHEMLTYGIFAAPANLSLAGYLVVYKSAPIAGMVWFLFALAIISTLLDWAMVVFFICSKTKFEPLFACFTFPLAISCLAMYKTYAYSNIDFFYWVALVELILSTIVIVSIAFSLIIHTIWSILFKHKVEKSKNKFINWFL